MMTFESLYREIVPRERIVYTSTMSADADVITVSLTTVEFKAVESGGTRLVLTEQGAFLDGREEPAWRENGTADQLKALAAELKHGPGERWLTSRPQAPGRGRGDGRRRDGNRPAARGAPARPGGGRRGQPALPTPGSGAAVKPGTLFFAASAAKGIAASLAHVLAERGDLDYDLRLADVWPEFAAHGKERTTLRHVLMHTAGLPGLPPRPRQRPVRLGPHVRGAGRRRAVVGAGHPVRLPRADLRFPVRRDLAPGHGPTMSELLREYLTGPLGVADEVCFAVPRPLLSRVARQQPAPDRPSRRSGARRSTGPCRPRCATRPASAATPACSPRTSRPSAR